MKQATKIILASGSPRRKELLERVNLQFEVIKSDAEEIITKSIPCQVVEELASIKAHDVSNFVECQSETMIIGSDTIVVYDGKILGKPEDEEDALKTLMELSGKTHSVYTGVYVIVKTADNKIDDTLSFTFFEETKVKMYPFSEKEAKEYIASGEPMDKAGSYGIQGLGGILVEKIDGDYNNVVGFPLSAFVRKCCEKNLLQLI